MEYIEAKKKLHVIRQCRVFHKFYREYFKKSNGIKFAYHLATGVLVFLFGAFMMIPYQLFKENRAILVVVMAMGYSMAEMYLTPYKVYMKSRNTTKSLWGIFQYLPVSKEILFKYQFKKLLAFQTKFYVAVQAGQLLFCLAVKTGIELANILYPVLCAFMLPLLLHGIILYKDTDII